LIETYKQQIATPEAEYQDVIALSLRIDKDILICGASVTPSLTFAM